MPATAAAVSAEALDFFGIESWSHAPAALQTRVLAEFNAVLQHIYSLLPDTFWRESEPRSEAIRAPQTITVSVTAGSKAITFSSPSWDASWTGCTLIIGGDPIQNILVHDVSASPTLHKAYAGTTGSQTATLYHDAITLPDAEEVLSPVMLDDHWELVPMRSQRHFNMEDGLTRGRATPGYIFPLAAQEREIRTPSGFLIVPAQTYLGSTFLRMRLTALPDTAYTMTYRVKGCAPARVTTLADTRTWLVPHDYVESILLPMLRFRLAAHPNSPVPQAMMASGNEAAGKILEGLRPRGWQPQEIQIDPSFL